MPSSENVCWLWARAGLQMLKLARLHFHECGYVDSYKDSLTIDLRDPRDGRLLDAVFNFENGGGKTGMLSLFFSCFDTRLDRFLRTLIRKHERFDHEFGDKPGAIIAEWAMPSNTASLMRDDPRRLITVQLVRQVRRAGVKDLERHFLLFRCGPTFDFEALLSSLRPDGRASVSRDQVPEFLHRLRADIKPVQFWDTTNQEQWKARLEENGLDVDLLRMQVDFNREEGGIDHFLDIKDEREFLLKFLNLTLNPQTAESTRTVLLENINKLGERQSLKDRFTVLQGLRTVFALFSLATAHWLALLARLATGRAEAAGLAVALEAARSSAHQAEQIAKAALEQTQKQLQSLAREIADAEAMQAALAHEDLRRRQLRAALALKEGIELNRQATCCALAMNCGSSRNPAKSLAWFMRGWNVKPSRSVKRSARRKNVRPQARPSRRRACLRWTPTPCASPRHCVRLACVMPSPMHAGSPRPAATRGLCAGLRLRTRHGSAVCTCRSRRIYPRQQDWMRTPWP